VEVLTIIGAALGMLVSALVLVRPLVRMSDRISRLEWMVEALWDAAGRPEHGDFPFRKPKD
jgi:hypothetical protein